MLCAPLLFVLVGPAPAVGLLAILGLEVNLLTLATERRRPNPLLRETGVLLAWSIPGALVGVAVLRSLDAVWLQVALSVTVLATLAARRRSVHGSRGRGAPLAGLAAGALTTATSAAGPPLLIHLLGRGHAPGQVRDTLTLCFVGLSPIGVAALLRHRHGRRVRLAVAAARARPRRGRGPRRGPPRIRPARRRRRLRAGPHRGAAAVGRSGPRGGDRVRLMDFHDLRDAPGRLGPPDRRGSRWRRHTGIG